MTALTINDLSAATTDGTGVFDVLMRATKAHLDQEFKAGRIKGPEYSEVYLGGMTQAMQTGLAFLLQKQKTDLEAQLLQKQINLADVEILKAQAEKASIEARTALTEQQRLNAITENAVLVAQECKLRAEFDLTQKTTLKTNQEIDLLAQKTATERAQVTTLGVDDNSVIGRQKQLYKAQTDGFTRDAEQKAAKLMIDSWNVRRTTDEATVADGTNMLNDLAIGRAVNKLLTGVGA